MARYDAFISYSRAKDKPIAAALQSAVQKLGKSWYRRRCCGFFATTPLKRSRYARLNLSAVFHATHSTAWCHCRLL
jgi:hypothetical protein